MCGIAGFVDVALGPDMQSELIKKMLHTIDHRGRNCSSFYIHKSTVLGHNRLSIIDTSSDANQPFHHEHLTLIFNGEIYNYIEIREELIQLGCVFRTKSDSEVVIQAYSHWGQDCVLKFMGMWAFAIYDHKTETLFCSRDRFGIKPFYYIWEGNRLYFGSEIKTLELIPNLKKDINTDQLHRFLYLGMVTYKGETFWNHIQVLEPACNLILTDQRLSTKSYWSLKSKKIQIPFDDAREHFLQLLKQSILQHLRSDVKVGACLSGGIDSSTLVSIISHFYPFNLEAYNVFYSGKGETDERVFVKNVVEAFGNVKPHYITPSNDDINDAFLKMAKIQDGPIPGSGIMSQYFLFKTAGQQDVKVMIDGQGADEYLAGYHNFYPYYFSWLLKNKRWTSYIKEVKSYSENNGLDFSASCITHLKALKNLCIPYEVSKKWELPTDNILLKSVKNPFSFSANKNISWFDSIFWEHIHLLVLPDLLHFEDRNSMAFTIESRVPYLDHRLVEYAFSLPFDFKIRHGKTKYILRESARGITPQSILDRVDKKGFTTPGEIKWLRGCLKHLTDVSEISTLGDICHLNKVKEIINYFRNGDNSQASLVWRLVSLNAWIKIN